MKLSELFEELWAVIYWKTKLSAIV